MFSRPGNTNQDHTSQFLPLAHVKYGFVTSKNGLVHTVAAAQASRFIVCVGGRLATIEGTSASSSAISSIIALLNDVDLASAKRPLGWFNLWEGV